MTKILVVTLHLWFLSTAAATSKSSFSPPLRSSSFVAPFTRPARLLSDHAAHPTLSDEATTPQQSMDVRELMYLLEETYPSSHTAPTDANNKGNKHKRQQWARTRNYLYQYRANLSRSTTSSSSTEPTTKKRKRRHEIEAH
ncbi:hypothetical protein QTG54_008400 [Skeletonema marinoi]|uniref:Uncharacterized protein n=1 Tax=Skeletonema marinoi TaxID=267567 RepID=A0AAD9DCX0_9STRA|nr:hypothetical protein QTG54_008400 [Skeletonema marinoi]